MDYKPYCLILSIRKFCPILSSLYCGRSFSKTWYTTDRLKVYNLRENLDKEPRKILATSEKIWTTTTSQLQQQTSKVTMCKDKNELARKSPSPPPPPPPPPLYSPPSFPSPSFFLISQHWIGGHYRFYSLLKMFIFKYTREELRESVGWGDLYL